MRFSVIIPTFSRGKKLNKVLSALTIQSFPVQSYEIIIVDNDSKDQTAETVSQFQKISPVAVIYILERRPGLHWARHAGAIAAHGEILAYLDDDTVPEPNWLEEIDKAYIHFDADCVGGKINICWDRQPPEWVLPYESLLGKLDYGDEYKRLDSGHFINGGNFTILKKRLFEIGGFNPDQIDRYLIGDGETGLCMKIHQRCWTMVWAPKAEVYHIQFVDKNGTVRDIRRRYLNNGVCKAYNYYRTNHPSTFRLLYKFVYCLVNSVTEKIRAVVFYFLNKRSHYYPHEMKAAYLKGEGLYYLRLVYDEDLRKVALIDNWIELV